MIGVAVLLGLVAVVGAALLERRLAATADAPLPGDLDARLRAGFPRAVAPWLAATLAAALALGATLAAAGAEARPLTALVVGAAVGAAALRGRAGLLAAGQVAALALAAWLAPAQGDGALAWAPVVVGVTGALTALVGIAAARVGPHAGVDDEAALARALVRPLVVSAALLLVVAELLLARQRTPAAEALRAPIGLGVALAVAATVGAGWPLPVPGERGGGLLRLGALLRPAPVFAAVAAAGGWLVFRVDGAVGLSLGAATLAALSAAPLGAASFCERTGARATARALRFRLGLALAALTLAAAVAAAARPTSLEASAPARAAGAGASMIGAPTSPTATPTATPTTTPERHE